MIRIGVIGTGGMAKGHAKLFQEIKGVKLVACCDVLKERAQAYANEFGIPTAYDNYEEMMDKEKLDGITNVTPDRFHAQVALAVIKRGIHLLSEKPLASTLADAKKMCAAAEKKGVINMVNFSYRNAAALQKVSAFVRGGGIGELRHVEASYLQGWLVSKGWGDWRTSDALLWRLSTRHGSAGTLGDIGVHIYDMTSLICGDITEINCTLRTFDKGVKNNRVGDYIFDANDSFVSQVTFAGGAMGTIHSTRWATGQPNSLRVRAYGTKGA
ncbi:MAG: Gfo/Idh/MocA family oxidoreductase, partial [Phycisphaeraceae bacterium]|nr:Gfo/Idh/MocA family oxidoreductase [Phycisphaeraceae bacterium]